MKIVADENIPFVEHYFGRETNLILKPGRAIVRADLVDADLLLVRSVTQVNEALLYDTTIKFVGTVTAGIDHLDTQWLQQAGIEWADAQGSNADAVVEYVVCVIAALQKQECLGQKPRVGVIGVGNIGTKVVNQLIKLNFEVVQHDPLRALHDKNFISTPLEQFSELDLVTLHTPLTLTGKYPTYHLVNENFLSHLKRGCILLNASRGAVIDFSVLKKAGQHVHLCLDVWENEPIIDPAILQIALIATPHIAGYSVQSKLRGVKMIYEAAYEKKFVSPLRVAEIPYPTSHIAENMISAVWQDIALKIYNPLLTTQQMRENVLKNLAAFDLLRKEFPERHEFAFVHSGFKF